MRSPYFSVPRVGKRLFVLAAVKAGVINAYHLAVIQNEVDLVTHEGIICDPLFYEHLVHIAKSHDVLECADEHQPRRIKKMLD